MDDSLIDSLTVRFKNNPIIIMIHVYRVSIKSFPDYKHLLQENYVE